MTGLKWLMMSNDQAALDVTRYPYATEEGIDMTDYFGSCLCGTAKFKVQGTFERFYLCHCQHCQKDTGSAHAANIFSSTAQLTWLAGADSVITFTLPGTRHKKSFCQHCGSALPSIHNETLLVVPAGCLDTPIAMLPTAHIFTSSRAAWDNAPETLPMFEKLPN